MTRKKTPKTEVAPASPETRLIPPQHLDAIHKAKAQLDQLVTQLGQTELHKVRLAAQCDLADQALIQAVKKAAISVGIDPDGPDTWQADLELGAFVAK